MFICVAEKAFSRQFQSHIRNQLQEVSFSTTLWSNNLIRQTARGFVVREKTAENNFGKPKFTYHIPLKATKKATVALNDPRVELVAVAFSSLRRVCRFWKDDECREKSKDCSPQICPPIRK
jgi:hypothetical protein